MTQVLAQSQQVCCLIPKRVTIAVTLLAVMPVAGCRLLPPQGRGLIHQVADLQYNPPIQRPNYKPGQGLRVAIDEAHHNFHTSEGRYKPFAQLLRRDGYRVFANRQRFSVKSLQDVDVLVIANALHQRNEKDWTPPYLSAFQEEEISAVREWVEAGGAILLIADHAPFPAAAHALARAFGIEFCNCTATAGKWKQGNPQTFNANGGLMPSSITRGRSARDDVSSVMTFTGSAFKLPAGATPVLRFGADSTAMEKAEVVKTGVVRIRIFPIDGWAQGAVMPVGKGRLAVFGEAAMFSAQRFGQEPTGMNRKGAEQNHILALNLIRWLGQAPRATSTR